MQVGRFVVSHEIGAGGMGVVFAAEDPELERTVAVKLLHSGGLSSLEQRARFVREAKAMAKLRHPNVVTVYEVGEHDGQMFIAMELLEGETLGAWLKKPRDWRAIRDVFLAAGRGLAAAHEAGVVHRDFKPSNVSVGKDGIRVLDFGLALGAADVGDSKDGSIESLDFDLTLTGSLVGTPAYMSPEQLHGIRATARSDQWGFCVTLYQALYGVLPFKGGTVDEMTAAMRRGATFPPGPPRSLIAVLRRGLQVDPAARFPSMAALLAAMQRDSGRRLRQIGLAVAIAGAAAGGVAIAWPRAPAACAGARAHLAGVWDTGTRDGLRAAFAATGKATANDMFERLAGRLDGYADGWVAAHTAACEATIVRHEQSPELLDRRMACLSRLRTAFGGFVGTVTHDVSPSTFPRTLGAVGALGDIGACADSHALLAAPPPPADPELRRRAEELRRRIDETYVRGKVGGNARAAEKEVALLAAQADGIPYAPLRGFAQYIHGQLSAMAMNDPAATIAHFERAIRAADEAGDNGLGMRAWIALLQSLADARKGEQALGMQVAAESAVRRGGGGAYFQGELELAIGGAYRALNKPAEARAHLSRSLELCTLAPDCDFTRLKAYQGLGLIANDTQDIPAFIANSKKLIAETERVVGKDHMFTGTAHQHLGAALLRHGDFAGAERELLETIRVYTGVFGHDNPEVGNTLMIVSAARSEAGRLDEAEQAIDEAVKILEPGGPSTRLANALEQKASLMVERGKAAEARPLLERTLALRIQFLGEESPLLAFSYTSLGLQAQAESRLPEAVVNMGKALAVLEKNEVTGPRLAEALINLAEAQLNAGHAREALPHADRALGQLEGAVDGERVHGHLVAAKVLWAAGDRKRAVVEGHKAQALLTERVKPQLRDELATWMRTVAREEPRTAPH